MKKLNVSVRSIIPAIVTASLSVTMFMNNAYADSGKISKLLNSVTGSIYDILAIAAGGFAAVSFAIAGYKYINGDAREAEEAKKKGIRCAIGAVAVYIAPYLFSILKDWAVAAIA